MTTVSLFLTSARAPDLRCSERLPSPKMNLREGSEQERFATGQSAKPALIEAIFQSVFISITLFQSWRVFLSYGILKLLIGTRPYGIDLLLKLFLLQNVGTGMFCWVGKYADMKSPDPNKGILKVAPDDLKVYITLIESGAVISTLYQMIEPFY